MAGPGKHYRQKESGVVQSYEQLRKSGATDHDIKEMLDADAIQEVPNAPVTGTQAADTAGEKKKGGGADSSAASSISLSPQASDGKAPVPQGGPELPPTSDIRDIVGGNNLADKTALPQGDPAAGPQPADGAALPPLPSATDLKNQLGQPSETTNTGQIMLNKSLQQFQAQVAQDKIDYPRRTALAKQVRDALYSPENKSKYLTVKKPALVEAGTPDSKYTYLNTKELDGLLDGITDVAGQPITADDRQRVRTQLIGEVERDRANYDIVENAKRRYKLDGGKIEVGKLDLKALQQAGLRNESESTSIPGMNAPAPQEPGATPGSVQPQKDLTLANGIPTDPISVLNANRAQAQREGRDYQKSVEAYNNLNAELSQKVKAGEITSAEAQKQLSKLHVSQQGTLDEFIDMRVKALNQQTLPNVYKEKADDLKKQIAQNGDNDALNDPLRYELQQVQEKIDKGETYALADDPRWNKAMKDGLKDYIIENNEKAKAVFDNQAFNSPLDRNTPFRDQLVFANKQLTGLNAGLGGVEQMAGGVLNMYGQFTLGNHLTDRGKEFAGENAIPAPMDANGNFVIMDDDPSTWVARNISAQVPNMAALILVSEISGGAAAAALTRSGALAKVSPVLRGAMGGLIESVPEAFMEAGDGYNQAIDKGLSPEEATNVSNHIFAKNAVILGLTNPLEFGMMKLPTKNLLGKVGVGTLESQINGVQEVFQNWAQENSINPSVDLMHYALSPEGQSTYLAGVGMGVAQSAAVGQFERWNSGKETRKMFDFARQYNPGQSEDLPANHVIANTVYQAFQMKDSHKRKDQLQNIVHDLKESGTYSQADADRVNGIINDVHAVKDLVPEYANPHQQVAVLNELLQIHTNNGFKAKSGLKSIADMYDAHSSQSEERIKRIMMDEEPLYFVGNLETNKDQLTNALKDPNFRKTARKAVRVYNDDAFQGEIDAILRPSKATRTERSTEAEAANLKPVETAASISEQALNPTTDVTNPQAPGTGAAGTNASTAERDILDRLKTDSRFFNSKNPQITGLRDALGTDNEHLIIPELRQQATNPDQMRETFGDKLTDLVLGLGAAQVGRSAAEMTADVNAQAEQAVASGQTIKLASKFQDTQQSDASIPSAPNIANVPTKNVIDGLKSKTTVQEKLDYLKDTNLLQPITIQGKQYNAVDYQDRIMVMAKIGDVNVPFYISTGQAGKKSVKAGEWYAVFGVGKDGWINKGTEDQINNQYGHAAFQKIAKILNEGIGNFASREGGSGKMIDGVGFMSDEGGDIDEFNKQMNVDSKPADSHRHFDQFKTHAENVGRLVNEQLQKIATKPGDISNQNKKGGQSAIQEQTTNEGVLRQTGSELGLQEVGKGNDVNQEPSSEGQQAAKEEVAADAAPDTEVTQYGDPEKSLGKKVLSLYNQYQDAAGTPNGESEFAKYERQLRRVVNGIAKQKGIDTENAKFEGVHSRIISNIFDDAGAQMNEDKSVRDVIDEALNNYSSPKKKKNESNKVQGRLQVSPTKKGPAPKGSEQVTSSNKRRYEDIDTIDQARAHPNWESLSASDQDSIERAYRYYAQIGLDEKTKDKRLWQAVTHGFVVAENMVQGLNPNGQKLKYAEARDQLSASLGVIERYLEKRDAAAALPLTPFQERMLGDLSQEIDSAYNLRPDIPELTMAQRVTAVHDIRAGKDTKVARKLREVTAQWEASGVIPFTRGRGAHIERVTITAQEYNSLPETTEELSDADKQLAEQIPYALARMINEQSITLENFDQIQAELSDNGIFTNEDFDNVKEYLQHQAAGNAEIDKSAASSTAAESTQQTGQQQTQAQSSGQLNTDQETELQRKYRVLEEKKAKFKQTLAASRGKLNAGLPIDPKVIADGIDMLASYADVGMYKLREIVSNMIESFGREFFDKENTKALTGVYAYARQNADREEKKLYDSEDAVDDFIDNELPALISTENNGTKTQQADQQQTSQDSEPIETKGNAAVSEARAARNPQQRARAIKKIDDAIEAIDDELKLLGHYKGDPDEMADYPQASRKAFKKDLTNFSKQLAKKLGYEHDTDKKGKPVYANVNVPPAGGEGTIILWKPGSEYGAYISVPVQPGFVGSSYDGNLDIQGILSRTHGDILWRVTGRNNKYSGFSNQYVSTDDLTIGNMSQLIKRAVDQMDAKKTTNANNPTVSKSIRADQAGVDETVRPQGAAGAVQDGQTEGVSGTEGGAGLGDLQSAAGAGSDTTGSAGSGERGVAGTSTGRGTSGRSANEQKRTTRNQGVPADVEVSTDPNAVNHIIKPSDVIVPDGQVGKVVANMNAIGLLAQLQSENRNATPEEKAALAKFVGWGGLANYLNTHAGTTKVVDAIFKGGAYAPQYSLSRSAPLEFSPISTTGKSFDDIAKEVRTRFNQAMQQNRNLVYDVDGKLREGMSLDDARAYTIEQMLSPKELENARASTTSAYYTDRTVIGHMWDLAKQLGFSGGHVLESSAGVGHFIGLMPGDVATSSRVTAVEKDGLSGNILAKLYPQASVMVKGFEDTKIANNSVDLAIGNVPFGGTGLISDDKNKDIAKFNLNGYFIAKNLKLLKPGGIAMLITSANTMDNFSSAEARRWYASAEGGNSDFIGAVRLPNNAFEKNAGTEITTDVMVFQKRQGSAALRHEPFQVTEQVRSRVVDGELQEIKINEYYVKHPQNMIGEMKFASEVNKGGLFGQADAATLHAKPGTDVMAALKERFDTFPKNILNTEVEEAAPETVRTTEKDGRMYLQGGKVYVSEGDQASEVQFAHKNQQAIAQQYVPVRDSIHELVLSEQDPARTDAELTAMRRKMNELYDAFVAKHGTITKNSFLYDHDIDYSLASSVEDVEQKIIVQGDKTKKQMIVRKSDIFERRINFPRTEPTTAENLPDAIKISMSYRNHVNAEYIGKMLGMTADEAKAKLLEEELVFENPGNGLLQTPGEYLSGNVRDKYDEAVDAAQDEPKFIRNVAALEKVIPEDVPVSGIKFKMGVTYLPANIYQAFIKDRLGVDAKISYLEKSGNWLIGDARNTQDSRNTDTYAVGKVSGLAIITDMMNGRTTNVTKMVYDPESRKEVPVKDEALTAAAFDRQQQLNREFSEYVKNNDDHRAVLSTNFNRLFRNSVERVHDLPDFDRFPGASQNVMLRAHQKRAVLRILSDNTLLAHGVGTGKTLILITANMEMRRLGLAKKPMVVVQNATLKDFAAAWMKAYPSAKLIMPSERDMEQENRRRFFGRIATGDYDAVIIPQSQIDRIPDDPIREEAFLQERIAEMKETLENMDDSTPYFIKAQMKKQIAALADDITDLHLTAEDKEKLKTAKKGAGRSPVKLEALKAQKIAARIKNQAKRKTDNVFYFDQLGIDALSVDEAHAYKKLGLSTGLNGVRGIDTAVSKRALSILLKIRSVKDRTGGRNITFATGTPITNTMAEAWTMMRFLKPEMLDKMGIQYFDRFIAAFAEVEPSLEQNAGGAFEVKSRLSRFFNMPELISAFRSMADVVTTDDIPEFKENPDLSPPKLKDGKISARLLEPTEEQKKLMRRLLTKYEEWKALSGDAKKERSADPMMLAAIAKAAAIDLRLVDPHASDNPNSKVNAMIDEAMDLYHRYAEQKGTQMIFMDKFRALNTPNIQRLTGISGVNDFNMYDDIRRKLIERGVPASEVVVINESKYADADAKKLVFDKMNDGIVRFAIGGTDKMGVGVNAQQRMIGLHHLDVPDRPDQFIQREGRMVRQGNMFAKMDEPVNEFSYGVKNTRDGMAFNRLRIKEQFISQLMKGKIDEREMEDPTEGDSQSAADYFAEMGASLSGSRHQLDLVIKNKELNTELQRRDTFKQRLIDSAVKLRNKESGLVQVRQMIERADAGLRNKQLAFPDGTVNTVTVDGVEYQEKLADPITKKITDRATAMRAGEKNFDGFEISINNTPVTVSLVRNYSDGVDVYYDSDALAMDQRVVDSGTGVGLLSSFRRQLDAVDAQPAHARELEKSTLRDIENLQKNLQQEYDPTPLAKLQSEVEMLKRQILEESEQNVNAEKQQATLDQQIAAAKKALDDEIGGQLSSGIPLNALPQLTRLAGLYLQKGLRTVSEFARAIGQRVSKVINQAWEAAKKEWKASQNLGVISPSMRRFMAAGAQQGGGTSPNQANTNPPGAAAAPKTSLGKLAQDRADKLKDAIERLDQFNEVALNGAEMTDSDWQIKPTILGRVEGFPNKVQDLTVKRLTQYVSKNFKALVEDGLEDRRKLVRSLTKAASNVFANLGKTETDISRGEQFAGETKVRYVADAVKIGQYIRELVGNEQASLNRIDQVLDPEFYEERTEDEFKEMLAAKIGADAVDKMDQARITEQYDAYRKKMGFDDPNYKPITRADLTKEEMHALDLIRTLYDILHDVNYGIGKLTQETYEDNLGEYSARLYTEFEIPKEAKEAMRNGSSKLDESLYMERGELNSWKLMNRVTDPVYAVTKRLYQTMSNKAIIDYADYIVKAKPDAVRTMPTSKTATDKEKDMSGFRKMGWGYGALSNKYVRNDIAEDFIGHFYADGLTQKVYDMFKAYDKMPLRQFYKKIFTVYNPSTHLGNITGNYAFAFLTGITPWRLTSNVGWARQQANEYSPEYRYLLKHGLLQSDLTQAEHKSALDDYSQLVGEMDKNWWTKQVSDRAKRIYSATDDIFKMAAFKSLLEQGYKPAAAMEQVKQGFQNYHRVGKAYDLFSKAPVIGNPFGRFAGDLSRIFTNSLTTRPLGTVTFLGMLKLASMLFSHLSGEPDWKRRLRESRAGFPKVPLPDWTGGDIPLAFKVGGTEWNMARFLSPLYLYGSADGNDGFEFFQKLSPQPIETVDFSNNPGGKWAAVIAKNANDPVVAPLVQLMVNSDFRGTPILDPKATKFKLGTLTFQERAANAIRFLTRAYVPYYPLADDLKNAATGDKDYYGRTREPWQVIVNFIGPKITEFPDTRYGEILKQKLNKYGYSYKEEVQVVHELSKLRKDGKISEEDYTKRITPHLERQQELVLEARKEYEKLKGETGTNELKNFDPSLRSRGKPKEVSSDGMPDSQSMPQIEMPSIDLPTTQ